jgi:hypothetical protein
MTQTQEIMLAVLIKMATSFNLSTMHQQDLLQANQFYVWIPCADECRSSCTFFRTNLQKLLDEDPTIPFQT